MLSRVCAVWICVKNTLIKHGEPDLDGSNPSSIVALRNSLCKSIFKREIMLLN